MTFSETTASFLAQGGWLALLPLFLVSCLLFFLVFERSRSLGIEVLDLIPGLRKKKAAARGRVRETLAAYLSGPSRERRDALRLACAELQVPLARFGGRLAREGVDADRSIGNLEVREAALLTEIEIERGLAVIGPLSRAALLIALVGTFHGLSELFRSMGFAPGAATAGLFRSLMVALVSLAVSLAGTACAGLLARRALREGQEVRMVCARARGLAGEVG